MLLETPTQGTRGANALFCVQGGSGRINDLSLEQWRKIQSVNYDSVFYAMKAVGPIFEQQGSGSFIATTSISAHIVNVPLDQVSPYFLWVMAYAVSSPSRDKKCSHRTILNLYVCTQSAYNASKAGVMHLCKSVARDWRLFARVNTISPGSVSSSSLWVVALVSDLPEGEEPNVELTSEILWLVPDPVCIISRTASSTRRWVPLPRCRRLSTGTAFSDARVSPPSSRALSS